MGSEGHVCPACGQPVETVVRRHKTLGAWVPRWMAGPCHNPACGAYDAEGADSGYAGEGTRPGEGDRLAEDPRPAEQARPAGNARDAGEARPAGGTAPSATTPPEPAPGESAAKNS
ncbi:hypothetical protein AB0G20_15985 [Streptomyces sp. NPDC024017]|uniref:hypothetical protein n=1 Tax=Streptomyces sp. NPDC024017 TaxID=3154326 RepID=UPI0034036557